MDMCIEQMCPKQKTQCIAFYKNIFLCASNEIFCFCSSLGILIKIHKNNEIDWGEFQNLAVTEDRKIKHLT